MLAVSSKPLGKPAKSWYSYEDLLSVILEEIRPVKVLEFGSGESTKTISAFDSVERLYSVEHDKEWFNKIPLRENITPLFREEYEKYRGAIKIDPPYDLIFVDGKERQAILSLAPQYTDLVLLHDADRPEYREFISLYSYQIWNKAECTVALTDKKRLFERIEKAYASRCTSA